MNMEIKKYLSSIPNNIKPLIKIINKKELQDLYLGQKLTTRECAKKLNVSHSHIQKYLKFYRIKIRNKSESQKGKKLNKEHRIKLSLAHKNSKNSLEASKKNGFKKGHITWNKGKGDFKFICKNCGKEVLSNGAIRKYKFCSKKCKNEYSHKMRGNNHWNYKGLNNNLQRNWVEYKEWHKEVLIKDNFTCQVCGKYGGNLEVHHKKSFSNYPELRFDVDNGMTVCKNCHLYNIHSWKRVAISTWP